MRDSNKYDGNWVVVHTLRKGDTLSSVAQHYHFKNWTPIWIYNTKVRPVLKGNPDNIPEGANIFIPRSKQGYDRLIVKLKALALQMQYSGDKEKYSLEGDYYKLQAFSVAIDAVGDALTTIATIGLQARKAAEMLSAAEKVSGAERVAAEYLASKQAEKVAETIKDGWLEKLGDYLADKASSKLPEKYQEPFKKTYDAGTKTAPKVVKAIRGYSMQGGKALLDISEIVLQYLKPSTVADLWLAHVRGVGTTDSAYEASKDQISHTVANSCKQLYLKRLEIEKERDLLYSSK